MVSIMKKIFNWEVGKGHLGVGGKLGTRLRKGVTEEKDEAMQIPG